MSLHWCYQVSNIITLAFDSVQDPAGTETTTSVGSSSQSPVSSLTPLETGTHESDSKSSTSVVGAAVGGAIGGLLVIIAACAGLIYLRRRSRTSKQLDRRVILDESPGPSVPEVTSLLVSPIPFSQTAQSQTASESFIAPSQITSELSTNLSQTTSEPTTITRKAYNMGKADFLLDYSSMNRLYFILDFKSKSLSSGPAPFQPEGGQSDIREQPSQSSTADPSSEATGNGGDAQVLQQVLTLLTQHRQWANDAPPQYEAA